MSTVRTLSIDLLLETDLHSQLGMSTSDSNKITDLVSKQWWSRAAAHTHSCPQATVDKSHMGLLLGCLWACAPSEGSCWWNLPHVPCLPRAWFRVLCARSCLEFYQWSYRFGTRRNLGPTVACDVSRRCVPHCRKAEWCSGYTIYNEKYFQTIIFLICDRIWETRHVANFMKF